MAGVPVPVYQQFWADKRSSLPEEHQNLVKMYPDAASPIKLLFKVLCDIEDLAGCKPASVGKNVECATIVSQAVRVRVRVSLRLTVRQSVCLGVEPRLGLMTR
jgi:hypothetical protein